MKNSENREKKEKVLASSVTLKNHKLFAPLRATPPN
jgi:hypothetical protein